MSEAGPAPTREGPQACFVVGAPDDDASGTNGAVRHAALRLFNDELLEILGGSWSAPPLLAPGWTTDPRVVSLRALGRDLVATVHSCNPWRWEDPRNSLLLPFWREILDVRPMVVLACTDPSRVAGRLAARHGLEKRLGLALWERYVRSAIEGARGLAMSIVPHAARVSAPIESDPDVTNEQRALFRLLERARDQPPADLPPESPGTARLIARRAADERARRAARGRGIGARLSFESVLESAELDPFEDPARYRAWLDAERPAREAANAAIRERLAGRDPTKRLSVLCDLDRAAPARRARALESLRAQIDSRWELWVAGSPIAGDLVLFLDPDDALAPEATAAITRAFDEDPTVDLVYADEDSIDDEGRRRDPSFKPDWSPEFLLSTPYLGRPLALRRSLFDRLGGLDAAEPYDLELRATELARSIRHLPEILYHRARAVPLDVPRRRRALADALARRGESARVEDAEIPGAFHVRRAIRGNPLVSIVIPFRDQPLLLERCVRSIHELAGHDAWEALCVDNRSWQPETKALVRRLAADRKVRMLSHDAPFNWSAVNNRAAAEARGDLLLFLNDDVEARRAGWLAAMIEHAQRDEVGAVGARLLYPNGMVQHAGMMLHPEALARHPFRFLPEDAPGHLGMARLARDVTAVTGACLMVRRSVFDELHGFDETLPLAFNDVDFCLRLRAGGYRVVYTPLAVLAHHEGISRGLAQDPAAARTMLARWSTEIGAESFISPRLGWRRARIDVRDEEGVP